MKKIGITLLMVLVFGGCASPTLTVLRVSGDGGESFHAEVQTSDQRVLTVATLTLRDRPHSVLQTTARIVSCDLRKEKASAHVVAEVVEGGRVVVRAEAPAGTKGVRLAKAAGAWQQHAY